MVVVAQKIVFHCNVDDDDDGNNVCVFRVGSRLFLFLLVFGGSAAVPRASAALFFNNNSWGYFIYLFWLPMMRWMTKIALVQQHFCRFDLVHLLLPNDLIGWLLLFDFFSICAVNGKAARNKITRLSSGGIATDGPFGWLHTRLQRRPYPVAQQPQPKRYDVLNAIVSDIKIILRFLI